MVWNGGGVTCVTTSVKSNTFCTNPPLEMPLASAICHLVNERKEPKKLERFTWALALLNIHPFFVWGPSKKKNKKKEPLNM